MAKKIGGWTCNQSIFWLIVLPANSVTPFILTEFEIYFKKKQFQTSNTSSNINFDTNMSIAETEENVSRKTNLPWISNKNVNVAQNDLCTEKWVDFFSKWNCPKNIILVITNFTDNVKRNLQRIDMFYNPVYSQKEVEKVHYTHKEP